MSKCFQVGKHFDIFFEKFRNYSSHKIYTLQTETKPKTMKSTLFFSFLLLAITGYSQVMTITLRFNQVIELQRKAIFLSTNSVKETTTKTDELRITSAGLHLMHEKNDQLNSLNSLLISDMDNIISYLSFLEDTTDFWDVDKLAFIDLTEELVALPLSDPILLNRIQEDLSSLRQIQMLYNKEMMEVFGTQSTRSMQVRRKMWNEYVQFLQKKYNMEDILDKYSFRQTDDQNFRAASSSIWGYKMPAKTVMFTFDDGPHYKYTSLVLETLKKKNIPAIFFELGDNIATRKNDTTYNESSAAKYSKEIANTENYLLGSHSLTHPLLTKLDSMTITKEIYGGFDIIQKVTGDTTNLFRPPYGGINSTVINTLSKRNSKPFMWNIDSRDWADPVPASIANRVVDEAVKAGRGIILMHDIHEKTVQSLDMIIDSLHAKGFQFILWNGEKVLSRKDSLLATRGEINTSNSGNHSKLYREKWALVIGINEYKVWPKLQYAVNDARGIADVLQQKLEFKKENIILLENEQATRKNILEAFGDNLINSQKVEEDDAVFIFYAGHGMTRPVNSKKSLGYIVPVDADLTSYSSQAISMSEINDLSELIPARHVFWIMDACYSGLALTRGVPVQSIDSKRYLKEVTNRRARQIITAGGANEEVADGGPNGHSIFTWSVINALSGDADINGDGFITASEICNYVPPNVSSLSRQTPAYGNMIGSTGGDFIFQMLPDQSELNESTQQYDKASSDLLQQIAELRAQLAAMESKLNEKGNNNSMSGARNENLQQEDSVLSIGELNSLGLKAYRQKNYNEALANFRKAIAIDSSDVQPINNLGFVYYKMGNYHEALVWIQKAIELAPGRTVAYLNLADVELALGEKEKAIANYEKYLSMAKENNFTKEITEKVNSLKKE